MCESPAAQGEGEWYQMIEKGRQGPDHTGPWSLRQSLALVPRSLGRVLHREMIQSNVYLSKGTLAAV